MCFLLILEMEDAMVENTTQKNVDGFDGGDCDTFNQCPDYAT